MDAAILLGLMAAMLIPWLGGGDDTVEETPISEEPEEEPTVPLPEEAPVAPEVQPDIVEVMPLTEGTDESEIFNVEAAPRDTNGYLEPVVINANGGDDILALIPEAGTGSGEYGANDFINSTISGGAGDDMIEIRSWSSEITGGDGNDTINVSGVLGNTISGGAGDDQIIAVATEDGDGTFVDGNSGNDTIDARGLGNGAVNGGEGDDTILLQGRNFGGTGFGLFADGGADDDTLIYEISPESPSNQYESSPFSVRGGEGADTYRLVFNEGYLPTSDIPEDADLITMGTLVTIENFEPGVDTLELQPSAFDNTYQPSGLRLEEDEAAGTTNMIVSYTSETEIDRDVVITLNAVGVELDDIVMLDGSALEEVA